MRWTIVILFCLAVASAKYGKQSRFGRMLQSVADLEHDIENDFQDSWNGDEDSNELSDDDDVWQEPQRHHFQPRQKKGEHKSCPTCGNPKRTKWMPIHQDDEDYESQESDEFDKYSPKKQRKHHRREQEDDSDEGQDFAPPRRKKHQRREREEDEPKQKCKPDYEAMQKLDELNANLAAKLHREAKHVSDDKNTVVSPVAVQLALAAVAQGARGSTKRQINQLLDFGMPKSQYQNAYAALTRALKGQGSGQSESQSVQIKATTNLVLGQQSAQEQFIEAIKNCFDGEVKKCDFRQKPQQCRDQINQWVSSKTNQKLQHPLSPNALTGNTKMVAIGTMQLKASWGKQFRKNLKTAQGVFYPLREQKPISVKVLQTEGEFSYTENEQMKVLGMQTQEKQLTVYVFLPKDRHGLSQMEKQRIQYGQQLQQLMDHCDSSKQTVKVELPAFQIIYKMDTKQLLRKLGIEDAFDGDQADFSGVNDETEQEVLLKYGRKQAGGLEDIDVKKAAKQYKQGHQLHLNKLVQQATIQVDENGIDAANGRSWDTGRSKSKSESEEEREDSGAGEAPHFKADHAFAFIVKHNPTNQILLAGRVIDAAQKAEDESRGQTETERD